MCWQFFSEMYAIFMLDNGAIFIFDILSSKLFAKNTNSFIGGNKFTKQSAMHYRKGKNERNVDKYMSIPLWYHGMAWHRETKPVNRWLSRITRWMSTFRLVINTKRLAYLRPEMRIPARPSRRLHRRISPFFCPLSTFYNTPLLQELLLRTYVRTYVLLSLSNVQTARTRSLRHQVLSL